MGKSNKDVKGGEEPANFCADCDKEIKDGEVYYYPSGNSNEPFPSTKYKSSKDRQYLILDDEYILCKKCAKKRRRKMSESVDILEKSFEKSWEEFDNNIKNKKNWFFKLFHGFSKLEKAIAKNLYAKGYLNGMERITNIYKGGKK